MDDDERWERKQGEIDARINLERVTRLDRLAEIARHVLFEAYRAGRFADIGATHDDVELLAYYMFRAVRDDLQSALADMLPQPITDEALEAGTVPIWNRTEEID